LLQSIILDRVRGRELAEIARAFHRGIATGLRNALIRFCGTRDIRTVALSGGVFQNELLLRDLHDIMQTTGLRIWTNQAVPTNDGGISLGQAALAAFAIPEIREVRLSAIETKIMHELSIAMSIVETAQEEAERRGWAHVHAVHLKLGLLTGVVKGALLSSYEMACEATPLQGSRLVIEEIPVEIFCAKCDARRRSALSMVLLSGMRHRTSDVVQGKELQVVGMEITE